MMSLMQAGLRYARVGVAIFCSAAFCQTVPPGVPKFPSRLGQYLTTVVRPTPAEYKRLIEGAPIAKLLVADPNVEVCVFGGLWINATVRQYIDAVQDIENFERGHSFMVTKRISSPPRVQDFALMKLPEGDVSDLRRCEVGDCKIQLGRQALERFRTEADWNAPGWRAAANALMGRLAYEYVNAYLEGGNDRLAVYRDNSRPTFVAREFRSMVDQMPELTAYMPSLRRYLLDFPKATLPGANSFLYWQETRFGLKPTIRISHVVIREGPENTVMASKMLYASHYFWTALELRALVPDPSRGPGFWLFTVSRSRSDGLSGFTGRIIRGRVRREAREGILAALKATKRKLEKAR